MPANLVLTLLIIFGILSPNLSQAKKSKIRKHKVNYSFTTDEFITLSPRVKISKNPYLNFYKINFTDLGDDVVATRIINPDIYKNQSVTVRARTKKNKNFSNHIIKMDKNIESSIAYLKLETYKLNENGELELKESLPIRLNIAPRQANISCPAVIACGRYSFPDKEIIDYIGTCIPGKALVEELPLEDCEAKYNSAQ